MRKVSLNYSRCDCSADRDGIEDHDRGDCSKLGASELRQITEVRGLYGRLTCMEH